MLNNLSSINHTFQKKIEWPVELPKSDFVILCDNLYRSWNKDVSAGHKAIGIAYW